MIRVIQALLTFCISVVRIDSSVININGINSLITHEISTVTVTLATKKKIRNDKSKSMIEYIQHTTQHRAQSNQGQKIQKSVFHSLQVLRNAHCSVVSPSGKSVGYVRWLCKVVMLAGYVRWLC